jgi:hypothetical protein
VAQAAPDTPVKPAATAFAFESLEVASTDCCAAPPNVLGDAETVSGAERILEQEEAAELVAGTFDRALEIARGAGPEPPDPGHAARKAVRAPVAGPGGHGAVAGGRHRDGVDAGRRAGRPRPRATAAAALATVALLAPASGAVAHTLYYGPARAAALSVAANTQAAVTADPDIPAVGTGHGASACRRTSLHSWRCRIWVSARGLGRRSLRCDQDVVIRYVSTLRRAIRVFTIGRPACR